MTYEAAIIAVNKPGFFSKKNVREACQFVLAANNPPNYVQCDHMANQNKAQVVFWAMGNDD